MSICYWHIILNLSRMIYISAPNLDIRGKCIELWSTVKLREFFIISMQ